jgi:hypothetical protein
MLKNLAYLCEQDCVQPAICNAPDNLVDFIFNSSRNRKSNSKNVGKHFIGRSRAISIREIRGADIAR